MEIFWHYIQKIAKVCNNICIECDNEFIFYKTRFEKMLDYCFECNTNDWTHSHDADGESFLVANK